MIWPTSSSIARLRGISVIATFLMIAARPAVAAVSLGPITTNAARQKMNQELKFNDAEVSLQQQIDAGKARYELRQAERAEAIRAMAAQLEKRRQAVAVPSTATSFHNNTETGRSLWILLIFAALGAGVFGGRYYRNRRLRQHHTS